MSPSILRKSGPSTTPLALAALYGAARPLGKQSRYLNLGYWAKFTKDYDKAAEALVDLIAARAGIGREDIVLDAGFGFGDQILRWATTLQPKKIIGVNLVAAQVESARRRVAEAKLSESVELIRADATRLPLSTSSVTRVVAVESALHFGSRLDFFHESWRVLANGGRIAIADIVPRPGRSLSKWTGQQIMSGMWAVPAANLYDRETYARLLDGVGFDDVEIEDISHAVSVGFGKHVMEMLDDPETVRRLGRAELQKWHMMTYAILDFQYILVTARKPELPFQGAVPSRSEGRTGAGRLRSGTRR